MHRVSTLSGKSAVVTAAVTFALIHRNRVRQVDEISQSLDAAKEKLNDSSLELVSLQVKMRTII